MLGGQRRGGMSLFIVYLVLALYFLNSAFSFIILPDFFTKIDKWIVFLGAIFLVLGGISHMRMRRNTY